jgi:glucose-6-phosphate 1-epimerase
LKLIQQTLGAQILQAQCNAKSPIFYISPIAIKDIPRRGGVPILFPQFADFGRFSKHGFARNLDWSCLKNSNKDGLMQGIGSHYFLDLPPNTVLGWDHHARLEFIAEMTSDELIFTFKVTNLGRSSFSWTGGLHPYFYVEDLISSRLIGLAGASLLDRYDPQNTIDQYPSIIFEGNSCERLYHSNIPIRLDTGKQVLNLSSTGFSEWMIWNPGEVGANHLADLPHGDWRHFICIEPVNVTNPIAVESGEEFCGSLSITYPDGAKPIL